METFLKKLFLVLKIKIPQNENEEYCKSIYYHTDYISSTISACNRSFPYYTQL